ncbi:MAG: hypothetical protein ACOX41_09625 [Anaerovoracaceae bacterium]|jgi:hypothetical protein
MKEMTELEKPEAGPEYNLRVAAVGGVPAAFIKKLENDLEEGEA